MKKHLPLTEITSTFHERVNALLQNEDTLSIDKALSATIRFFEAFDIVGVDRNIPDYDMLLFQYGLNDLQNDKGEIFCVNFTRQFYIEDVNNEEFYQLGLTMNYERQFFKKADSFSKWSIDFPTITEWVTHIKSTIGYQTAEELTAKSYSIELGLT